MTDEQVELGVSPSKLCNATCIASDSLHQGRGGHPKVLAKRYAISAF